LLASTAKRLSDSLEKRGRIVGYLFRIERCLDLGFPLGSFGNAERVPFAVPSDHSEAHNHQSNQREQILHESSSVPWKKRRRTVASHGPFQQAQPYFPDRVKWLDVLNGQHEPASLCANISRKSRPFDHLPLVEAVAAA
jgi:hypothetical protein